MSFNPTVEKVVADLNRELAVFVGDNSDGVFQNVLTYESDGQGQAVKLWGAVIWDSDIDVVERDDSESVGAFIRHRLQDIFETCGRITL